MAMLRNWSRPQTPTCGNRRATRTVHNATPGAAKAEKRPLEGNYSDTDSLQTCKYSLI